MVRNVGRGAFGNANAVRNVGRGAFGNANAVWNVGRGAFSNTNAVRNVGRGTFGNAILNCKFDFFYRKMYCRGGSRLNRPYKQVFVGAAGTTAAPNRPYKCIICRDGSVGAAGQIAPTKGYEPSLKIDSVVVIESFNEELS